MSGPLSILLVDDDPDDRELVARELQRELASSTILQVNTHEGLQQALELGRFDLVITDYQLHFSDGLTVIRAVKARHPHVPVLMFTASGTEQVAVQAMKAGAEDYLVKSPRHFPLLPSLVRRALHDAQQREQARRAETALRRSEERRRLQSAALEAAANAIVVTDAEGRIVWANPAFSALTGYPLEEAVGRNPRFLKSDRQDDAFYAEMWRRILSGGVWQGTLINRRKDGSLYSEEMTITPVRDASRGIGHFVAVKQDVSERRRLEEQLRQGQKMEAVGQLAGGIAHDFNNVLNVINGYASLLARGLPEDEPRRHFLDEIVRAAGHAADLTRQLLAFGRRQVLSPRLLDLDDVLKRMEGMLRRTIGEHIELSVRGGAQACVRADRGQLEQLLMNLVVNARDAMPGGGRLTLETADVELGDEYVGAHPAGEAGRYVMLAVSDTGHGMDAATRSRIFEPFFTTKEAGRGTGLGLATVYGIVKQSGGYVWVYSEPGQGTTFKIYLPRVEGAATALAEEAGPAPARTGGDERLLLVEDDPMAREMLVEVLSAEGYSVVTAKDGEDALALVATLEAPVQLLLTDVVMPRMGGRELAGRLAARRPELRVLYMSGYPSGAITHHSVLEEGFPFLQKPFTPDALCRKVREVLDAPSGAAGKP